MDKKISKWKEQQLKCKTCGVALVHETYYYDDYATEDIYICENEDCIQTVTPVHKGRLTNKVSWRP